MNVREKAQAVLRRVEAANAAYERAHPGELQALLRQARAEGPAEDKKKKKKANGWFKHHYTHDKDPLIRSKRCYVDPVPYPFVAPPPHPATLHDTPSTEVNAESAIAIMSCEPSECHYSILHSPTYKKTQRIAQKEELNKLRDFRTVAKRSEHYSALWWTWNKRSNGGPEEKDQECRPPDHKTSKVEPGSVGPFPSPVSIRESSVEMPSMKRRRLYSGYELCMEAGDDPRAKQRVSDVLHRRCHDRTKHLRDPFVTRTVGAPSKAWVTLEDWLDDVCREDEVVVLDEESKSSEDSWYSACSELDGPLT